MSGLVPGWLREFAMGVHLANGIRHGVPRSGSGTGWKTGEAGVRAISRQARPADAPARAASSPPIAAPVRSPRPARPPVGARTV
ncbi:hypothetical protein [Nocardia sp. NPDC003345]